MSSRVNIEPSDILSEFFTERSALNNEINFLLKAVRKVNSIDNKIKKLQEERHKIVSFVNEHFENS